MDTQPEWNWSSIGSDSASHQPTSTRPSGSDQSAHSEPAQPRPAPNNRRYGPRTCRICLDVEEPKYPSETNIGFGLGASSRPTYESDDPELGRLLSPCKCKGSQKYVHEGCLGAWRKANPTETRNYWQCPTCKFTYRLSRLHWATALSSKWARMGLTFWILLVTIFALGFIADPIFDLWSDPVGTIGETITSVVNDIEAKKPNPYQEPTTWYEHLIKGLFSFGIIGMAKSMFAMTPWDWWWFRSSGIGGNRRQGGRGRVENISLVFVLIGIFTFMMTVWKFVQALSVRVLNNVSERVIDVDVDDGEDDEPRGDSHSETKKDE